MATEAKRLKKENQAAGLGCIVDERLQNFLLWCEHVHLTLSDKVLLSKVGTTADYGMLATEDIEEGHVLFSIPRSALLHPDTSSTRQVLTEGASSLASPSGWVPLLLALMHEYTSPDSHWRPYLSLWADFRKLDHPMFWSREEREALLKGTGIPEAVDRDLVNIQTEYNDTVLPFIRSHPALWDAERHSLQLYQSLVAFVMAYSFQEPNEEDEEEPSPPMMVPMADMLNHVSNHNANLEYTSDRLKMVAVRRIKKGEEVFNTYGQLANAQLLHMYGFTEPFPTNANDTADIRMTTVYQAAVQGTEGGAERSLLEQKWKTLRDLDLVEDDGVFVFGLNGSLTETELYTTLKVLCMSGEEFQEYSENDGWEEEEEDEEAKATQALSFDGMAALTPAWKRILNIAAALTLSHYSGDVESDRVALKEPNTLGDRERRALQVRVGQRSIIRRLQQLTESSTQK